MAITQVAHPEEEGKFSHRLAVAQVTIDFFHTLNSTHKVICAQLCSLQNAIDGNLGGNILSCIRLPATRQPHLQHRK